MALFAGRWRRVRMDVTELKQIIAWMGQAPVRQLAITDGDRRLVLRKGEGRHGETRPPADAPADPAPPQATPASGPGPQAEIAAPLYGIFHLTPSAGAAPFVTPGQAVKAGQTLCLIEAMKVFNAVAAEVDGVIAEILAEPGTEVAAGQPLFRLEGRT